MYRQIIAINFLILKYILPDIYRYLIDTHIYFKNASPTI